MPITNEVPLEFGEAQRLLKRLTETIVHLESDATGIYNRFHHMVVVMVSGL